MHVNGTTAAGPICQADFRGYRGGWAAGTNDISPAVDPEYVDGPSGEATDFAVQATELIGAASDGGDIGSGLGTGSYVRDWWLH